MNRRAFVTRSSLTVGALALPDWFIRSFIAQDPVLPTRRQELGAAIERARDYAKPLLIFVVPEDSADRYDRGCSLGSLLAQDDQEALLQLALCEPVCATRIELAERMELEIQGDPPILFIETAADTFLPVIEIDPGLHLDPEPVRFRLQGSHVAQRQDFLNVASRALRDQLRAALRDEYGSLRRRREQSERVLSGQDLAAIDRYQRWSSRIDKDLVLRAAAIFLAAAEDSDDILDRRRLRKLLKDQVEEKIMAGRIPGSRWGQKVVFGCGSWGPCGTGYVPRCSGRFLRFFTR